MGRVSRLVTGSDNRQAIFLYEAGQPFSTASLTRVQIEVDDAAGTMIDSQVIAMAWSETVADANGVDGTPIQFDDADAGLSPGVYRDCRIRLFDAGNPVGVVWPDPLTLVVG